MMRNRDYHKKQSVKYGSEYHWRLYQASRNRVNIEIGKVNLVITAKKLANVIKTIQKLLGNLLILLLAVPVKQNMLMKLKLTIKLFATMKIYRKLLMNSL